MKIPRSFFKIFQTLFLLFFFISNHAHTQNNIDKSNCVNKYLEKLESETKFNEKIPQKFQITSYFYKRDIAGNTENNIRLTGEFTRFVKEDQIHCSWNNVQVASAQDSEKNYSNGKRLDFMDSLSYTYSLEILTGEFFKNFPDQLRDVLKTLIWDAPMIEFAYTSLDKLKYNEPVISSEFEGKEYDMAGFALLRLKGLQLTWTGVSKIENKLCALIQYKSFSNPVETIAGSMKVKGRSCYWGSFWVSLETNYVEHATLNEDVILKVTFPDSGDEKLINLQRDVEIDKI